MISGCEIKFPAPTDQGLLEKSIKIDKKCEHLVHEEELRWSEAVKETEMLGYLDKMIVELFFLLSSNGKGYGKMFFTTKLITGKFSNHRNQKQLAQLDVIQAAIQCPPELWTQWLDDEQGSNTVILAQVISKFVVGNNMVERSRFVEKLQGDGTEGWMNTEIFGRFSTCFR